MGRPVVRVSRHHLTRLDHCFEGVVVDVRQEKLRERADEAIHENEKASVI